MNYTANQSLSTGQDCGAEYALAALKSTRHPWKNLDTAARREISGGQCFFRKEWEEEGDGGGGLQWHLFQGKYFTDRKKYGQIQTFMNNLLPGYHLQYFTVCLWMFSWTLLQNTCVPSADLISYSLDQKKNIHTCPLLCLHFSSYTHMLVPFAVFSCIINTSFLFSPLLVSRPRRLQYLLASFTPEHWSFPRSLLLCVATSLNQHQRFGVIYFRKYRIIGWSCFAAPASTNCEVISKSLLRGPETWWY